MHKKDLLTAVNPPVTKNHAELQLVAINIAGEGTVGTRVIKARGPSGAQRRRESRALAAILCAIVLPLALAFVLVAMDMRSDLSELMPAEALPDGTAVLIGWQDLEIPEGKTVSLEQTRAQQGRHVRMLGYMMESNGRMFLLMPEAGHILHPAHRIPDQMVEVWSTSPVPFRFRSLVWSTGILATTRGSHRLHDDKPLYTMANAEVQPAVESDISLWFKP